MDVYDKTNRIRQNAEGYGGYTRIEGLDIDVGSKKNETFCYSSLVPSVVRTSFINVFYMDYFLTIVFICYLVILISFTCWTNILPTLWTCLWSVVSICLPFIRILFDKFEYSNPLKFNFVLFVR